MPGSWGHGPGRRLGEIAFYNDVGDARSLNAVDSYDNSVKSDHTPLNWVPKVNRCRYIEDWVAVKTRWNLKVTAQEKAALLKYAAPCGNPTLAVTRAG